MNTIPAKKRAREADRMPDSQEDTTKRTRHTAPAIISHTPYIVVHRVECSRTERYHQHHAPSADYLDVPLLLAQSNRKSSLQGQERIRDIGSYLEDHNDLSFAVYITYSCTRYHETIKDEFKRLPMPAMDDAIAVEAKPYFYILQHDAKPAAAETQALILSEVLQEAIDALSTEVPEFHWNWSTQSSLVYPYLELYHQKELLKAHSLKPHHQSHLGALYGYLTENLGPEYSEAEALFDKGFVDRQHWAKLLRPGAVVVTFEGGQPTAYVCLRCPAVAAGGLQLRCFSWAFDGKFFQNKTVLNIHWPSDSNIVPITDLEVYPLTYGIDGLKDELRTRGEIFWACRSRKFVNYNVPLRGMEVQIVRLRIILRLANRANIDSLTCDIW
jgi:hypothetical protein